MPSPNPLALREYARHVGTQAGRSSADSRGLDDWDALALDAATEAERFYLARHSSDIRRSLTEGD